jgi:hypothetical protein
MTNLHHLCAVELATSEDEHIQISTHNLNTQRFLRAKRMNNLLALELGLLCAVSDITQEDALKLTCQAVVKRLLDRTPVDDLRSFLGTVYNDYTEYDYPHHHLGRSELDRSYPSFGLEKIATDEQMIVMNILGKIIQDDDDVAPFFLLLSEALTGYMMLTLPRDFATLSLDLGIPEEKPKEDNVIAFGKPSVDSTFDPFEAC